MPKPCSDSGQKNLISENLIEFRKQHGPSQRDLARELQIHGCDMDKNVITRIETRKRYVMPTENDVILVRVSDIQRIFGCGRKKAYKIMHIPSFPSFKLDGIIYVEQGAFLKWMSTNKYKNIFTR